MTLKYFDLADVKRSQTYNPDFKDKPDEVFNGLMKSIFYGPVTQEYYRDQASDVLSNLTNLLFLEFKHVTRMDYQNLISNEIQVFRFDQSLGPETRGHRLGEILPGKVGQYVGEGQGT